MQWTVFGQVFSVTACYLQRRRGRVHERVAHLQRDRIRLRPLQLPVQRVRGPPKLLRIILPVRRHRLMHRELVLLRVTATPVVLFVAGARRVRRVHRTRGHVRGHRGPFRSLYRARRQGRRSHVVEASGRHHRYGVVVDVPPLGIALVRVLPDERRLVLLLGLAVLPRLPEVP